jgi:hypothetical protein
MACECRVCQRGRPIEALAARLPEEDARLVRDLHGDLLSAEMDAAYYRAKYRGEWPSDERQNDADKDSAQAG